MQCKIYTYCKDQMIRSILNINAEVFFQVLYQKRSYVKNIIIIQAKMATVKDFWS